MSLFPFVKIKLGPDPISLVPPEFIQSFEYKSTMQDLPSFQFSAIDPTFYKLEQMLLRVNNTDSPVLSAFGYIDRNKHVVHNWIRGILVNYTPKFTHKGTEITANFLLDVGKGITVTEPQTFTGKVSDVAYRITELMDVGTCIETTNDEYNTAHEDYEGGPKQWRTENKSLMAFIRKVLAPQASFDSKEPCDIFFTHGLPEGIGSKQRPIGKPTLHFHSGSFECGARGRKVPLKLTYLAGKQDKVIDFSPDFQSDLLGAYGRRGLKNSNYDPTTCKYGKKVENVVTTDKKVDSESIDELKTANPQDPNDQNVTQLTTIDKGESKEVTEVLSRNRWSTLFSASWEASLTLVGLPEFVDIEAHDLLDLKVLIPHPTTGQWIAHPWAGGRYLFLEAVHRITNNYLIECRLQRDV